MGVGGGAASTDAANREGVFDLHVSVDALFGGARPNVVRLGPMLDLRTSNFVSAEAAAAVSLSLPLFQGFPITASAGVGVASRPSDRDATFGLCRLAFGYHPYNYLSRYAYALGFYADLRHDVGSHREWSIAGGIEIDLEFLVAVPVMFVAQWITRSDPDESE